MSAPGRFLDLFASGPKARRVARVRERGGRPTRQRPSLECCKEAVELPRSAKRGGSPVSTIEVKVPDIGDFKDIPVIEVFVKPGDAVKAEDSLVTLESDKATMDVPSPASGTVKEVKVKLGDKVSEGSPIVVVETGAAAPAAGESKPAAAQAPTPTAAPAASPAPAPAPPAAAPAARTRTCPGRRRIGARRRRRVQGRACVAVGEEIRARARRRPCARDGLGAEGPDPAGGCAEIREAGDERRRTRRRAASAAAARSISCHGPRSISRSSVRSKRGRCPGSRRFRAPTSRGTG